MLCVHYVFETISIGNKKWQIQVMQMFEFLATKKMIC